MPLALPSGVQTAIERATRMPVLWGRITMTVLDRVLQTYNDWTTLSGGTGYVSSYQTQVVKEHTIGSDPLARVQMSYPAQPGDPITLVDAFTIAISENAVDHPLWISGEGGGYPYQSITLRHGSQDGYPLDSFVAELRLESGSTSGNIQAVLYDYGGGSLVASPIFTGVPEGSGTALGRFRLYHFEELARSETVAVSSLGSAYTEKVFAFSSAPALVRGRQYLIMLYLTNPGAGVFWRASIGAKIRPGEHAGSIQTAVNSASSLALSNSEGLEFSSRVRIKPYRYDGISPPTHRERITLSKLPDKPGYLDLRYRTPGDSRIRFRLWKNDGGLVELGSTDNHTLYRDGHDGSVTHVHDGHVIGAADLATVYEIEANFLGTNGFASWAPTTVKADRAVVKPSTVNGFLYENTTPGGTTGSTEPTWPTVPGATVVDGSVTWRALRASFLHTAEWHAGNVRFPDEVFDICSSQTPILEALPCIGERVPSIAMRLAVDAYITEPAKLSLPLVDLAGEATRKLERAHLKNLPIELRLGYIEPGHPITSPEHLAPYFAGLVDDFSVRRDEPTLSLRDAVSADLDVQIPAPRVTSAEPATPLDFTDMHLVDALDQIVYSECGRPRRYQERESWADVKAALGPLWITSRIVAEPTSGRSLAKQILELIGAFMVPDESGRTRLVQYPRTGSPTFALGDQDLSRDPEQRESFGALVNAAIVGYGGENRYVIDVNETAQDAFAPGSDRHIVHKVFKGEWLGSARYNGQILAQIVGARETKHKGNGLRSWICPTSHAQLAVQVGDIGTLTTDVALRRYEIGARRVPATVVVISKRVFVDRDAMELEVIDAAALKTPPQPVTPGDFFTLSALSGSAPFSITANATGKWFDPDGGTIDEYAWDQDYDGLTFQTDATGINPTLNYGAGTAGRKRIALRVKGTKDGLSATTIVERVVRAKVAPLAQIVTVIESNPGHPNFLILSGAQSESRSSQIVRWTWFITLAGAAEAVLGEGVQQVIPMPYRQFTVRLEVVDADGLSHSASQTFTGKQLAPPDVQNFLIQQRGEDIILTLAAWTDGDIEGVELRAKYEPTGSLTATWTTADLITPDGTSTLFKTTEIRLSVNAPYGTWAFFAKLKDTSGNYSTNAVSILATFVKPGTRYPVTTNWSENNNSADWTDTGKASQLVYEASTDSWLIGSTGDTLGGLPAETLGALSGSLGSLGTMYSEGIYTCEEHGFGQDITGSSVFWVANSPISGLRVMVTAVVEYLGDPEETDVLVEVRAGTWNGASVDWGPWGPLHNADMTAAAIQPRIILRQYDGASNVRLKDVIINVDLPRLTDDHLVDQTVAIGGTSFTFTIPFRVKPSITYKIQNMGTTPLYVDETAKSGTGVTLKLRNNAGTDVGSGSPATQLLDITATAA